MISAASSDGKLQGILGIPRHQIIIFVFLAAMVAIAPLLAYPVFVMKVMCFAIFAMAFNMLLGFGGLLSFGHAAFFGSASYITAQAAKRWELSPELAILAGLGIAALMGFVVALFAIRRHGIYFTMVTLALAQMVYFFCLQAEFTGGEDGIQGVPRGSLFGLIDLSSDSSMYMFVAFIFLASTLLTLRIVHSPFGQVLKSIRENEDRATSLGYDVDRYKLIVFVLSAAMAGLAGSTKAIVFQTATLVDVHWSMSGEAVLMSIVGGLGTNFGPIVGAIIMISMQNYMSSFGEWIVVLHGLIFVLAVLMFRQGVVGKIAELIKRPL